MNALPPRIEDKIVRQGGCWLWQGWIEKRAPRKLSYGKVWWEGSMRYAHRVIYTLVIGPIPDGMQLDHVKERGCVGPPCVNPFHMEPVTARENIRRGNTGKGQLLKCECGKCRTCKGRVYMRRYRAERA